jgi:hypothetical protein
MRRKKLNSKLLEKNLKFLRLIFNQNFRNDDDDSSEDEAILQLKHEISKASLDAGYHTDFSSSASPSGSVLVVKSPEMVVGQGSKITVFIPRNPLASDSIYPSSSFVVENATRNENTPISKNDSKAAKQDSPAKNDHVGKSHASTSTYLPKVENNVASKKSQKSKPKEIRRQPRLKFKKICCFGCF